MPRKRAGFTKYDLLVWLAEVGDRGLDSYNVAEGFAPRFALANAYLWRSRVALLRLTREGLARRTVQHTTGRRGVDRWIYRYRITPRGRARLAYWRGR